MLQPHPPGTGRVASHRIASATADVGLAGHAGPVLVRVSGRRAALTRPAGLLWFCGDVFVLTFLVLTVVVGPVASNRIVHLAQRRTWTHSLHHAFGVAAILYLVLQVATALVADPAGVLGALAPFTSVSVVIGLGTVAAHLLLTGVWTRFAGARIIGKARVRLRRAPPTTGHLSWLVAIRHGLSPRPPPAAPRTTAFPPRSNTASPATDKTGCRAFGPRPGVRGR